MALPTTNIVNTALPSALEPLVIQAPDGTYVMSPSWYRYFSTFDNALVGDVSGTQKSTVISLGRHVTLLGS